MRRIFLIWLWLAIFAALNILTADFSDTVFAQEPSPTPTYDPLVEPPLSPNPSEFELGRNLYWHWCMTCHGDQGQGLTDDWRAVWEEDHQNCWARGCHAGHNGDLGFPIPTVVPLIIGGGHLSQFATLQDLSDFLKMTHPPQHPGVLKNEEYRAIAVYVFTLNARVLATVTPEITIAPTLLPAIPTSGINNLGLTHTPAQWFVIILAIVILVIFAWMRHKGHQFKE
jgi:hypothetical protein